MSWESIIDQMKEWVLSKNYATEAWVLAKDYASKAWVLAKGYATEAWVTLQITIAYDELLGIIDGLECFVDRGDPAVADWRHTDFIIDSGFHDLDCSAIVPAGAKAILFSLWARNTLINKDVWLRKKGNTGVYNMSQSRTFVSNVTNFEDLVCPCDTNRFVSYRIAVGGVWIISLTVKGWWL